MKVRGRKGVTIARPISRRRVAVGAAGRGRRSEVEDRAKRKGLAMRCAR